MAKATSPVSPVVANPAVVQELTNANASAVSADKTARNAATLANASDLLDEADCGKRLDGILALYMPNLTHKAVRESFSAALAILIADKPVRMASTAVTTKADGTVSFASSEALAPVADKNEILPEGKTVTELSAEDSVAKLQVGALKQAATAAREVIGRARAAGGGRKATKAERAPFFDEMAAVLQDKALSASFYAILQTKAKADTACRDHLAEILRNCGMEVSRKVAKAPAKA
jgi:hypothetical protein